MSGGVRFKLSDCYPELRRRLEASLAGLSSQPLSGHGRGAENAPSAVLPPARGIQKQSKGPNKTEMRFQREILCGKGKYEAVTLKLAGGSRYTPDWMLFENGVISLFEVKGAHRFPSEGRALTAFREAREEFPCFRFHWVVWSGREWIFKHEEK